MPSQLEPISPLSEIPVYGLVGYIFDEASIGFRVPVLISSSGKLHTCEVAPSSKITEVYELPNVTGESITQLPVSLNKKKWGDLAVGSRCPMVFVEGENVHIQTLEDARAWVLACALRANIDPYQRVSFSSVLSLPVQIVSKNYLAMKPVFADAQWLERQAENYLEMQRRLLGSELHELKEKIEYIESNLFNRLAGGFQHLLSEMNIASFRNNIRQNRISNDFISPLCEALSAYLHSFQIYADNNSTARDLALRTLYIALTYLDVARSRAFRDEEIDLAIEAQKLTFSLYIAIAIQRFLAVENDINRKFCLTDSLPDLLKGMLVEKKFLDAGGRFKVLGQIFFNIDGRSSIRTGSGCFVKILDHSKHGTAVVNSSGIIFTMPSERTGYGIVEADSSTSFIRVEKLRTDHHVTSNGSNYVTNTLDCYFPSPRRFYQRTFAGNSIHMVLCEDQTFADIVRASKSHQSLTSQLNVRRLLLVKYRKKAFAQMKEFIMSLWGELKIKYIKKNNIYLILLDLVDGRSVDARRIVGFYRALEILCELSTAMVGVSDRIRFIVRSSNVDSILRKSDVFRDYLNKRSDFHSGNIVDGETVDVAHILQEPLLREVPKDEATHLGIDFSIGSTLLNFEVNSECRYIDNEELGVVLSIAA